MSLQSLERAILQLAREVFNNRKLRLKDLREWSTGDVKAEEGEVVARLPDPLASISVCVRKDHDKRPVKS